MLPLLLACDVPTPKAPAEPEPSATTLSSSPSASALPTWADRTWPGGSLAVLLGPEHVALSRPSDYDTQNYRFYGAAWVLADAHDGAAESDAVAAGALEVVDGLGDLDGDGLIEWFARDEAQAWLLPGSVEGELPGRSAVALPEWRAYGAGDLDGDVSDDLLGFSGGIRSGLTPTADPFASVPYLSQAAGVGDLDGDGVGDLVLGDRSEWSSDLELRLLAGPLAGTYAMGDGAILEIAQGTLTLSLFGRAGDVDGDGLDDLAVLSSYRDSWATALYTGGGALTAVIDSLAPMSARPGGDLDGDGFSDLALWGVDGVLVVHGPVAGSPDLAELGSPLGDDGWAIQVGDVDGDAISDVMVSSGAWNGDDEERVLVALGPL